MGFSTFKLRPEAPIFVPMSKKMVEFNTPAVQTTNPPVATAQSTAPSSIAPLENTGSVISRALRGELRTIPDPTFEGIPDEVRENIYKYILMNEGLGRARSIDDQADGTKQRYGLAPAILCTKNL